MNIFIKIKGLLNKKQKINLIIIFVFALIGVTFELLGLTIFLPLLIVLSGKNISEEYPKLKPILNLLGNPDNNSLLMYVLSFLILFYVIKFFFLIYLNWKQAAFTSNLSSFFTQRLYSGYINMPYKFHLERNSSSLIGIIQGEVTLFSSIIQSFLILVSEVFVIIGIFVFFLLINPGAAIYSGILVLFFSFIFNKFTKQKIDYFGTKRQILDQLINKQLIQGLHGIKDIKILGREKLFLEEFNSNNQEKAHINSWYLSLIQFPRLYLELIAILAITSILFYLINFTNNHQNLIPILGVFISAAFRILPSLNRILGSMQTIRYSKPVINLLYSEINLTKKHTKNYTNNYEIKFTNKIKFNNVTFSYDHNVKQIISNLNFEIKKLEVIGIIGESGSGKSTLIDIILGLHQLDKGEILVDEININNNITDWQHMIGYVPQTIYLIDDTIRKNIAFGLNNDEIDQNQLEESLLMSNLKNFVNSLPNGLDTIVGDRGVKLSGGQRQRIGIARALYNNPEILIFDEATSSLDNKTESNVMSSILDLKNKKTIIIVAHRLSTIKNCDKVIKISNGTIVEIVKNEIINN